MENSKISWTHHTFNPWIGCTKVSDGCKNCYAESLMDKRYHKVKWGPQGTRRQTSAAYWRQPLKWEKEATAQGWRYRVFCASLADVFEDRGELIPWRNDLFQVIEQTPHLDWLLLTKRPENIAKMTPLKWCVKWPEHVWVGTSVENQEAADKRIPHLLGVPAKVRFLSCEPLLGPVDLRGFEYPYQMGMTGLTSGHDWLTGEEWQHSSIFGGGNSWLDADDKDEYGKARIHWVICGGESGYGARPMHPEWARSLRDQCQATGVPFFFKQWASGPAVSANGNVHDWMRQGVTFADNTERTIDAHSWTPHATSLMYKVGEQAAGNLLDGVEYQQFPA